MTYCPVCNKNMEIRDDGTCIQCESDLNPLIRLKSIPETYFAEASRLIKEGDICVAIEKLIAALEMEPLHMKARTRLAELYLQKGLYAEAIAHFQKALETSPENEVAKNGLVESKSKLDDEGNANKKRAPFIGIALSFVIGVAAIFLFQSVTAPPPGETPLALYKSAVKKREAKRIAAAKESVKKREDVFEREKDQLVKKAVSAELERLTRIKEAEKRDNLEKSNKEKNLRTKKIAYVIKKGDSLTNIAFEKYGSARLWASIFNDNKDVINDPDILNVGETIFLRVIIISPK